jgi:hypothetical protein
VLGIPCVARPTLGEPIPVDRVDLEPAVVRRPDQPAELGEEAGLAVCGEPHDLVLVRRTVKPEVLGEVFIGQPQ